MIQKYKKVSKEYQKALEMFNMEHKKRFFPEHRCKKVHCYVESKLQIAPVFFSVLHEKNSLPIVSDFDKASFLIRSFKNIYQRR